MTFDWDEDKATRNLTKHGVSFDEAVGAFDDPLYIDFFDPEHSENEHRYQGWMLRTVTRPRCLIYRAR